MRHLFLVTLLIASTFAQGPINLTLPIGWVRSETIGTHPTPRGTAAFRAFGNKGVLFGGVREKIALDYGCNNITNQEPYPEIQHESYHFSDTYILTKEGSVKKWRKIETDVKPEARGYMCHAIDPINGGLWIHGGSQVSASNAEVTSFNDTWFFDMTSEEWIQAFPSNTPKARSGMGCDYVGGAIYMFGGATIEGEFMGFPIYAENNELWKYEIASNNWVLLQPNNASDTSRPKPRSQHYFMTVPGTDKLILHSGNFLDPFTFTAESSTEIWVYDVSANTWTRLNNASSPLPARQFQGVTMIGQNLVSINGDAQPPNPPMCCGQIIPATPISDFVFYNILTQQWFRIKMQSKLPPTRRSDAIYMGGDIIVVGGFDYDASNKIGSIQNPYTWELSIVL